MTGATTFTRRAGLVGILSIPLAVLGGALMAYLERRRLDRFVVGDTGGGGEETFAYVWFGLLVLCGVVVFAGLAVRHWHHFLPKFAVRVGAVGLVVSLVFQSKELALASVGVSALLVLVAVVLVGELPRTAAILLLAYEALDAFGVEWAIALGMVGWIWLALALWREPVLAPGQRVWEGNVVAAS